MSRLLPVLFLLAANATAAETPVVIVAPPTGAFDPNARETLATMLTTHIDCIPSLSPDDVKNVLMRIEAAKAFGNTPEKAYATYTAASVLRKVKGGLVLDVTLRRRADRKVLGTASARARDLPAMMDALEGPARKLCELVAANPSEPTEITFEDGKGAAPEKH